MINPISTNTIGGADKQVTEVKIKQEMPAAAREVSFLLLRYLVSSSGSARKATIALLGEHLDIDHVDTLC
jgi:hypothetical protein